MVMLLRRVAANIHSNDLRSAGAAKDDAGYTKEYFDADRSDLKNKFSVKGRASI